MIGIINYGMGNLRSVQKAFEHVGAHARILSDPAELTAPAAAPIDKLVLPGVGAFADGMEHLQQRGWVEPIAASLDGEKPFLGICLGMQLLFEGSQEDAPDPGEPVPGLAILPGQVVRLGRDNPTGPRLKVPHMGWNTLTWRRDDPILRGLPQGCAVYFVHSYFVIPKGTPADPITSASTHYGQRFCASIWRHNIWATQFHPEKSQSVGLKILANFAAL